MTPNVGKDAPRPLVHEQPSNGAARLHEMIEASVDCVITIDAQSTILEFNAAAERTFGYRRDDVIGRPLTEAIIPPALREAHRKGMAALQHGGSGKLLGQRVEMPAMRSDGSEFPVELTITRIGSQSPHLFTAYLRDITEQKRAEEELWQSLNLLRAITEGTTDAIFAKDREGRYLMINTAGARLVGKTPEEMIGLDDTQCFSDETRARIIERDRAIMKSGETRTDENISTTLSDVSRVYLTTKGPLRDSTGAISGLFGVSRDITERKQAEEALAEQAIRYKTLMETSADSIYVLNERGDLQEANAAFLRRRGYTATEAKGLNVADWDAQWTREQLQELLQEKLRKVDDDTVFETRHRCKDGSVFDVEVSATRVRIGGEQLFFCVTRDITERKRAEQSQRESRLRYEALVQSIDGIVWEADPRTFMFTFVSNQAERILGYPLERWFEGPSFWPDHMHPADRDWAVKFCMDATARGEDHQFEYRMISADGRVVWLNDIVSLHVAPDQSVILRGLMVDITERKRSDQALRESEARTRLLVKSSNVGLWDWNLVTDDVFFSPEWKSQLGYADGEVPGRYEEWESRLHPEDREQALRAVKDFREGRCEDYDIEFRLRHKDGSWRSILTRADLICDASGQPVRMLGCHIDITARKQAEQARRESDERFRQIAENISEVFWVWTAVPGNACLLYVSPAYATIWGRSCESLYSSPQSWKEALHPNDKEWVLAEIADLDLEKMSDLTYRILRPDQSVRWIRDRIFPVRDGRGVVVRFAGIAEDITESKTIENALKSAEEQYRSIFNNAVDGIFRTSPDGEFLVANPAAAHIFGFASPEELIEERRDIARQGYVDPRRREEFKRLLQEQGAVNDFEYEAYRKDGSRVWICENTRAVHAPSGEILYFEGIFEDVTDRKRAEEALNEQALRYKALMETSTDSIYVLDEKGNLQEANAAFLRRRGYTAAEAKGLNVADWDARWGREELKERRRKLAGKSAVFETRHRCKDGSVFDVEVCATGVEIDGEQLIFCVTRDITERKQAESALRQLAQVSAASSDYIALIGRDFRYQFVNDTYLKARGLHLGDMIGRHMKEIVGQERFEQLGRPQVEACLRGEEVESYEWTDFRPDLRCFLHVKVAPLRQPDGTISGAVMSGRDITARYEAEQAQREGEERFRQLAENINEVFWMSDPENTRMFYVSPAYETIWGRRRETLYSSPASWMDAIHPDDKERMVRTRTNRDSAFPHDNTYRIVRPDGSVRWIRDRGFPVHDETRAVVRFAGIAEDITEPKQTAEAQERALSLMLATLESTADGILVVNTEGKIETFNRLFAQMWRLSEEVLASKEDARALQCVLDQLIKPNEFLEKVHYLYRHPEQESFDRLVFKDGRIFERYSRPQLIGGKVAGRVWSFRDVTERRQAAKALEEANRQLRILSGQLFHMQEEERRHLARELHDEIGQSLTAAQINLKLIAPDVPAHATGRLGDSIELLDQLLRQVRQLSLDLHPSLLDDLGLAPALRSLIDQQAHRAGLRTQFFAPEPFEHLDSRIQTTGFRIAQEAITNVLRHAKAQFVDVHLQTDAGELRIKIVDDGIGFDLAEVERRAHEGAGFGLMGMRERAALVGGRVQITSSPGDGTTVEVSLPLGASGKIPV